ncbi:uncharacterized protein ColSpa_06715 [Colletotrichum spaethianum]|uniref:Uncharacterized protein n=1 Tax=Colletotrichum spaethianum TaxID=700344 RepID=A0AA37P7Z8_9PEZI|nr:uncharacterized protein ColSpa_06715 [Colletotrichum spaethianum]GKT46534.1 hypothetical protein ColSpa_06715 [Colletotrichum spaethianum]
MTGHPSETPPSTQMLRQNGRIIRYVKGDKLFLYENYKLELPRQDKRTEEIDIVNDFCENNFPATESSTAELLRFSHSPSTIEFLQTVLGELGRKLCEAMTATSELREAIETLDGAICSIAPYDYAMFMVGQEVPPEDEDWHGICREAREQAHE